MSSSGGSRSSFLDGSFDYRSLLPTRHHTDDAANTFLETESGAENNNLGDYDECSCLPEMSLRERLLGCGTCMIAGYLLSFGSFWRIKDLVVHHDPLPFVLNVTIGNLIALAGSFFLTGPRAQMQRMFHDSRRTASYLYLGSLFLTLFVAFLDVPGPKGLYLLILMICQYVSITWYCLSYIPFAQDFVAGLLRRRFGSG